MNKSCLLELKCIETNRKELISSTFKRAAISPSQKLTGKELIRSAFKRAAL